MTLRLETEGHVAHLLIDRLDKRNAFNMAMWEMMPGLLDQVERNAEAKVLGMRSAEAGAGSKTPCCAGADIKELLANKDNADWRSANQAAINRVQYKLARLDMPTLAFVEGDSRLVTKARRRKTSSPTLVRTPALLSLSPRPRLALRTA